MSTSVITRRRNTHLEPTTTDVTAPARQKSFISAISVVSSKSNFSLPSPRLAAAHAYYHEQETPTSAKATAIQHRKSLLEAEQFPRRHLSAVSPSALASQFSNFTFASRKEKLASVPESKAANSGAVTANGENGVNSQKIKTEKKEDVEMTDAPKAAPKTPSIKISDTSVTPTPQNTPITAKPQPSTLPPTRRRSASDVPYEYIHTRLRDWGRVYLNNISSADVFINPIPLRRPPMAPVSESEQSETKNTVNIRARVVPKSKDRKPIVIHQKFDVEDFRAKILTPGRSETKTTRFRRSNRHRSASQSANGHKRGKSLDALISLSVTKKNGSFPLHEEYALHFLPILAALLFSSHVCKGDTIDLPTPHPGAWEDVLKWVYVGGDASEVSGEVRENVAYLGGEVV